MVNKCKIKGKNKQKVDNFSKLPFVVKKSKNTGKYKQKHLEKYSKYENLDIL